jgi:hypothetical protein
VMPDVANIIMPTLALIGGACLTWLVLRAF